MKSAHVVLAVLALAGCATNNSATAPDASTTEVSEAIRAFEEVCLKTAPTFSLPDVANAAAAFGIVAQPDDGFFRKMGANKDESLGFIIEENKECWIITTPQPTDTLTKEFLQMVRRHSGTVPSKGVPITATVRGNTFIFDHDRRFGEAFIMVRQ